MIVRSIKANMTEVELADGRMVLVSYKTPVAAFVPGRGLVVTESFFSNTTSRHINTWVRENFPSATRTQVQQREIEEMFSGI